MNTLLVFKALYFLLDFLGGSFLDQEVLFEYKESKTQYGREVYIKYYYGF